MTFNMSQFHQVFFEETAEHLGNMESMLLEVDMDHPDPEQLNAIFRAAHSIKGSAGTFGFTDLADVTHILENLLDRIRKNELTLRVDMIDAFLDAGDVLKDLLAAHRGEATANPDSVAEICARLKNLTSDQPPATISQTTPPASPPATSAPSAGSGSYDIEFILDVAAADHTDASENLLAELSTLGHVEIIERPSATDQPWRLRLAPLPQATDPIDSDSLRETLEFIARSDSIRLTPHASAQDSAPQEEAYGFFADPAPAVLPQATEDDSFGFFDPLPDNAATPELSVAPASQAEAGDDAYGFFEPLGATATTTETSAAPPASSDDAYGFFTDLPAQPEQVPATPIAAAAPLAAVPAPPAASDETTAKPAPGNAGANADRRAAARIGDTSIRVNIEKVDQLINLVGELVITQAMLTQSALDIDPVKFERMLTGLNQLERNTRDLQETVMSIRMMPISMVFSRFPRVVRDISQKLGKQVELKTIGESTELDKGLIERIADPLTHLIRNSLDHGIESPAQRTAAGKQPCGLITLKAYHQSGNIVIEVSDDGGGLNRQRILAKARERGLPVSDSMTDQEVWLLIFEAGFSTAEQITEVSGRGVGMDVVKRNISALGGRVEIDSMTGIGTRITVRLPLTLAILDGMSVAIGAETYIIPIGYVIESLQASKDMIKSISGVERLIQVRGEYLPVVPLHEVFRIPNAVSEMGRGIMIVVEADGNKFALFVDALIGQHQVVIKSLEANYRKIAGISGATIMGDGRVAMILDIAALADLAKTAAPASA